MDAIDFRQFDDDSFEIRFGGAPERIAVETLSETLLGFTQALQEINRIINPHKDLEVFVVAVTPGSIRFRCTLTKREVAALVLAGSVTYDIVVGVFGNYVYDAAKGEQYCAVDVVDDGVRLRGQCDIIISKEAFERLSTVIENPKVAQGVDRAFEALEKDKEIESVQISPPHAKEPPVYIPREEFRTVVETVTPRYFGKKQFRQLSRRTFGDLPTDLQLPPSKPDKRERTVRASLVIIKAVLERGKRKWQFNWNGIKVSAPIKDQHFFDQLASRDIALHQGDALDADLLIKQEYLPDAKVWQNKEYEVIKVYSVTLGQTQTTMTF